MRAAQHNRFCREIGVKPNAVAGLLSPSFRSGKAYSKLVLAEPNEVSRTNSPNALAVGQQPFRNAVNSLYTIDTLQLAVGRIGMAHCPGKSDVEPRDLDTDLAAIEQWGASVLVTLVESSEYAVIGVPELARRAAAFSFDWIHLPIVDMCPPDEGFAQTWGSVGLSLRALLDADKALVLHCRGGLGRTGTVAAQLLVERGMSPADAIATVRQTRPGAIETDAQLEYVRALRSR
jgi:ADP-ribosyl-[dinitrogen reductase] hydrolase